MAIVLKESWTGWVDIIKGELSFFVEDATILQGEKLESIRLEMLLLDEKLLEAKTEKKRLEITKTMSASKQVQLLALLQKLYRQTIKYQVKDWKGVQDTDGEDIKIKLSNNEIEDKQFEKLIKCILSLNILAHTYECISKQTQFTETDKKK